MSNVIIMNLGRFAERLRRERERLGLTQKEFADKLGVSRMTQVNYESGKRYPREEYFKNLKNVAGIDEFYLAFGMHSDDISNQTLGAQALIQAIEKELGLNHNDFDEAWEEVTQCAATNVQEDTPASSKLLDETAAYHANLVISFSPALLDEDDLLDVLQEIEEAMLRHKIQLSPAKKARFILMLYRQRRIFGYLDKTVIEDAIALATEECPTVKKD